MTKIAKYGDNIIIADAISKIWKDNSVSPTEGALSHRKKRIVLMASEPDKKLDERKFELGNIFQLSEIISIEERKPKASKYKRALESTYKFRTDSGRKLLSVIKNKFYSFQNSSYALDNVENIKLKEKYPNFKTTMKKGLIACLMDNPVSEISFTVDAKKEGPISNTGLTF